MRKFLCLLFIVISLIAWPYQSNVFEDYNIEKCQYIFWTDDVASKKYGAVFNGVNFEVVCGKNQARGIKNSLKLIRGEGLVVYDYKSDFLDVFLLDYSVQIVSQCSLESVYVINGFSHKIGGFVKENGHVINLQIAVCSAYIKIGSPLILGSI